MLLTRLAVCRYSVRFSLLDTRLPHEFDNLQYVVFKDDDVRGFFLDF